jgi:chromosome segregation ATPase
LVRFLDDTEFWNGFRQAPLLCLDHLEKCLAVADQRVGYKRLLNDQSAKLNELFDDLIRFEATGTHGECESTALDWLADFAGPTLDAGHADGSFTQTEPRSELTSDAQVDSIALAQQYQEDLLFENEKLTRKVSDLMERLSYLETRAASLGYQVARLSEDNKRLEMGYTGANSQANGLKQLVQDLRKEIQQLKNGASEPRAKAAS